MSNIILETDKLSKTFFLKKNNTSCSVCAVKEVTLEVKEGEIFGLLGPNGAGKSTTFDMLATLLQPTSGKAYISGFDLSTEQKKVRKKIGYVSQVGGADATFNAIENLELQAGLYGLDKKIAHARTIELINRFQMNDFAKRPASSYSGGQKRRLELALGIINIPRLVFLDEPTTGLDPQSRSHFWSEIKKLKQDGITVFLTTHYLEEADSLCDRIAIIDHGSVIDIDTPVNMKRQIGSDSLAIDFFTSDDLDLAKKILSSLDFIKNSCHQDKRLLLFVVDGNIALSEVIKILTSHNISTKSIAISQPSLDDVFLSKTGKSLRDSKQ